MGLAGRHITNAAVGQSENIGVAERAGRLDPLADFSEQLTRKTDERAIIQNQAGLLQVDRLILRFP